MSPRRPNSFPAPAERAILEGRSLPSPSPRYELALSIRRLNQRLGTLPPERQARLLPAWNRSWDQLQLERAAAGSDAEELEVIRVWECHWRSERLEETFEASRGTPRGITQTPTHFGGRGAGDQDPNGHVAGQVSKNVGTDNERTFRVQK